MTIAYDDLIAPPTSAEVRAGMYAWLDANGCDTTSWLVGSVVRAITSAAAMFIAGAFYLVSLIAKGGFLSTAVGDWLTLCARYAWGTERIVATFASTTCTLTNTGPGIYTADIGEVKYASTTTGAVFANVETFILGASPDTADVVFTAVEAGSGGTTAVGTITAAVSGLTGVTCTNAAPAIGYDDESDAELQARALAGLDGISPNGPRDVYRVEALKATRPDGTALTVTRVSIVESTDTATVVLYAGRETEGLDPTDVGYLQTFLYANAVPFGVTLNVESATPVAWTGTYYVYFPDSMNVPPIVTGDATDIIVQARLVEFFASVPTGGPVYLGSRQVLKTAAVEQAIAAAFETAAGLPQGIWAYCWAHADVTLAANEFPVAGTITPHSGS